MRLTVEIAVKLAAVLAVAIVAVAAVPARAKASSLAKIHVVAISDSDAILLESEEDGHPVFGLIDGGEDNDSPDGSDPRYPYRPGTTVGHGTEEQVMAYLEQAGVKAPEGDEPGNLRFVIATHAHSDHIGATAQIVSRFRPERVYLMEYSDDYISNPGALWDNLYVYDRLLAATQEAGSLLIQHLDPDAPVAPDPDPDGPVVANPNFPLGSMALSVVNYEEDYRSVPKTDANQFSLGVVVEANGHRAFLAGDINDYDGDETRLAATVGAVDVLKAGHHGRSGSNTERFLDALGPSTVVMTAPMRTSTPTPSLMDYLVRSRASIYSTAAAHEMGLGAVVCDFSGPAVTTNWNDAIDESYARSDTPRYVLVSGGKFAPVSGWRECPDGVVRYFDNSPYMAASTWIEDGDRAVYLDEEGKVSVGPTKVDGALYLFDQTGAIVTGEKGWVEHGGSWLYVSSGGALATGWAEMGGRWYYLDPDTGAMATGWTKVSGRWYYLDPTTGAMATGWLQVDGGWYHFAGSGAMDTGWTKVSGRWYYLDPLTGAMHVGWTKVSPYWYYLEGSGAMATGWMRIGGAWYYLGTSGAMAEGWAKVGSHWYYLAPGSGAMCTGWAQVGSHWYYLEGSGAMATGWKKVGRTWYYLEDSGAMAEGWRKVGSHWYYLTPGSGAMVTGTHTIAGRTERFTSSGRWLG